MADVLKFVDSISATPTVRLDVSDESAGWALRNVSAPPPRLRRSMSANAMRDGINVGPSTYDARTLVIQLECIKADQDTAATELQKLARELNRETNFVMYQPNGLTKPVFFRTYRSELTQIDDVLAQKAMRTFTLEVLADPFALGVKESLGPFTVNNDPAAASNGHYVDVSGVIGDVAAPCLIRDAGNHIPGGVVAMRQHGTPSGLDGWWITQAESATALTDTSNLGGGPDAAMSGSGANNFLRTTFATTASMAARLEKSSTTLNLDMNGRYRVLAVVRRSDNTSVLNVQAQVTGRGLAVAGATVAVPQSTSRQVLDLGVFDVGSDVKENTYASVSLRTISTLVQLKAQRVSGTGSLDWDYFVLAPADESMLMYRRLDTSTALNGDLVLDGPNELITKRSNIVSAAIAYDAFGVAGGFPALVPDQTNRCLYMIADLNGTPYAITKGDTASLTFEYYPRYLFVRPAAS